MKRGAATRSVSSQPPAKPLPERLEAAIAGIEAGAATLTALAAEARARAGATASLPAIPPDLADAIKRAETEQATLTRLLQAAREEHRKVGGELEELLSRSARVREQMS